MNPSSSNTSTQDVLLSCQEAYNQMNTLLSTQKLIRNYHCRINITSNANQYTIQTPLFPKEVLQVYSSYNLEDDIKDNDKEKYFSSHRGGSQGDYRFGMKDIIQNVVECLFLFPSSKRAVITIPNNPRHCHKNDDDSKCMREIHFYLNENSDDDSTTKRLDATIWMRAQAAEIFPKNIHFIASLMNRVADELNSMIMEKSNDDGGGGSKGNRVHVQVGELFYLATSLVSVRED